MTTNCDIRSMLSVFFPFWRILSDGMPWILLTAVLSLLLDGAVLSSYCSYAVRAAVV